MTRNSKTKSPIATLYATDLTSKDLGSNAGLRVKKQMITRPKHGTARHTSVKTRCLFIHCFLISEPALKDKY